MDKTMSLRDFFDDSVSSDNKRRKSVEAVHFDRMSTYTFSCCYCHRKYYSAQALGGHQNAHKRERAATLASLTSFEYHKHHHHSNQRRSLQHLENHAYSSMSSSSLFFSPLSAIDRASSGISVRSMAGKPVVSSVSPSTSRGSSHLYVNHKQYPLQQAAQLSSVLLPSSSSLGSSHLCMNRKQYPLPQLSNYACQLTDGSEGANNCSPAGSSLMPPNDEGTTMLDLSLKL